MQFLKMSLGSVFICLAKKIIRDNISRIYASSFYGVWPENLSAWAKSPVSYRKKSITREIQAWYCRRHYRASPCVCVWSCFELWWLLPRNFLPSRFEVVSTKMIGNLREETYTLNSCVLNIITRDYFAEFCSSLTVGVISVLLTNNLKSCVIILSAKKVFIHMYPLRYHPELWPCHIEGECWTRTLDRLFKLRVLCPAFWLSLYIFSLKICW